MSSHDRYRPLAAISNPPNPFLHGHLEWDGPPPEVALEIYRDSSKSIISRNESPDIPFSYSVNPYRGCMHACAYCYARPTHEYLDFGAGTDFDRKIVIKEDAAALLREAFEQKSWKGEMIVFSGNTDCYQPLEATYGLTRACLEVCAEYRNPVSIITKSAIVARDVDVLAELVAVADCWVTISVPFWDPVAARAVEPFAPTPQRRIKAIAALAKAGIPVGVNIAPVIPGLNDQDVVRILEAAADAGAQRVGMTMVRLPGPVGPVFEQRIRAAFPDRADKILHRIEDARGGKRNESRFGARMTGTGRYWGVIEQLVDSACRRLGLTRGTVEAMIGSERPTFQRPPRPSAQLELFPR